MNINTDKLNIHCINLLYQEALACLEVAAKYLRPCGEAVPDLQVDMTETPTDGRLIGETGYGYQSCPLGTAWRSCGLAEPASLSYATLALNHEESEVQKENVLENNARNSEDCYANMRPGVWSSLETSNLSYPDGLVADQAVDQAVVEGLLDRCAKIITSVQARLRSDNPVIKESLVSLLRSLEVQQHLLLQKKGSRTSGDDPTKTERVCAGQRRPPTTRGDASRSLAPSDADDQSCRAQPPLNSSAPTHGSDSASGAVDSMRSVPTPSGGLAGVVGLEEVKQVLQEAFVWPLHFPHLFQGQSLQSWSRLLLYGPPGTGKTRLARALAEELRCPLYTVTPSAVLSAWLGESEKIIRELFRRARSEPGPVLVFFDEMDALCRTRSHAEDDCTRRIKTELLVHMDSSRSSTNSSSDRLSGNCSSHFVSPTIGGESSFSSTLNNEFSVTSPASFNLSNYNNSNRLSVASNTTNFLQSFAYDHPSAKRYNTSLPPMKNTLSSKSDHHSKRIRQDNFHTTFYENNYQRKRQESFSEDDIFQISDYTLDGTSAQCVSGGGSSQTHALTDDEQEAGSYTNQVFIIAATNCPWDVDPAFLRRFQKRCYVTLPDRNERRTLLLAALSGCRSDIHTSSWDEVLAATEGFSGADLTTLATAAAYRPIRELHTSHYWQFTEDNKIMPCSSDTLGAMQFTLDVLQRPRVTVRPVQAEDLVACAATTARSVPAHLLQRYQLFSAS